MLPLFRMHSFQSRQMETCWDFFFFFATQKTSWIGLVQLLGGRDNNTHPSYQNCTEGEINHTHTQTPFKWIELFSCDVLYSVQCQSLVSLWEVFYCCQMNFLFWKYIISVFWDVLYVYTGLRMDVCVHAHTKNPQLTAFHLKKTKNSILFTHSL